VHADRLRELADEAAAAKRADDPTRELVAWREALDLLPRGARQATVIGGRVAELGRVVDASGGSGGGYWKRGVAGAGGLGLLLWKLEAVALFVVTKGKALLLGATKFGTFAGVLASFGVYWAVWGWKFAAGLLVAIYVHELGHVVALRRFGIKASAPMFVPGLGAYVRLHQYPANAMEDARVGLAGPIWGTVAAVAAYAVFQVADWPSFAAIARFAAWINLFNLLPIAPLDGGRGFRALSRAQRWSLVAVLGLAWLQTAEGLLGLLLVVAVVRAFGSAPAQGDRRALLQYAVLVVALSALCLVEVPLGAMP
jgi:Zn-dependent protease